MARVALDQALVDRCRNVARDIASEVQEFIDAHTSVGVERTVARALGVEGVDDAGTPLANRLVDRLHEAKLLERGVSFYLGREMLRRKSSALEAAERLAYAGQGPSPAGGNEPIRAEGTESLEAVRKVLAEPAQRALARIDGARSEREAKKARLGMAEQPWKYVIVA